MRRGALLGLLVAQRAAVAVASLAAATPFTQRWAPAAEYATLHRSNTTDDWLVNIDAELTRSLAYFDRPASAEAIVTELFTKREAVFVVDGKVFMHRDSFTRVKVGGHGVLLKESYARRPFGNCAWLHIDHASGGDSISTRFPTTVIAKQRGYRQPGILVPNPYWGGHQPDGLLRRWAAHSNKLAAKAKRLPLSQRTAKVMWRGDCRVHGGKACSLQEGNRARLLGSSLTSTRPDLFDVRCKVNDVAYRPPKDFSCVSKEARPALQQARRDALRHPPLTKDFVHNEDYVKWRYLLNLPGQTTGSPSRCGNHPSVGCFANSCLGDDAAQLTESSGYSRNLNTLWAARSVVLLWDTSVVEWYYPALSSGVTHAVVNRSTAVEIVSRLNADPDLVASLSRSAKRVQAELVCADCIAAHIARVANRTRERMGYGSILDDADQVLRLAKQAGACDNFVSVEMGDRRNEQHTYAAAGAGLCAALAGSEKAPAPRSRWAPTDEFQRLHPNVSQSSWRERIVAEANRSVNFFKARRTPAATEELLREILGPTRRNWRDYAVFVLWGEVFLAKKYFGHVKVAGHGVLLRTAWQRKNFGNVAFLHASEASGGGDGNCLGGRAYRYPTTVIGKRNGYAMCGILVPNPYFGSPHGGTGGVLDRWAAKAQFISEKAATRPLAKRINKAFWRGSCQGQHKKPCGHDLGNRQRMLAASLTSQRPDLFDVRCGEKKSGFRPPSDLSCVSKDALPALEKARRDVRRRPPLAESFVAQEDYSRWRYLVNLPGQTSGSYSRNLNHLWSTGSVVMLWDTSIAEWYYPALAEGETHITINRSTAIDVVSRLNDDPARVAALGAAAKRVQSELLSADAIAEHLSNVAELVRKRMGYASILDDADRVLALAKELGACDHFVRVRVVVAQRYGKYATPGEGLCAWLQSKSPT